MTAGGGQLLIPLCDAATAFGGNFLRAQVKFSGMRGHRGKTKTAPTRSTYRQARRISDLQHCEGVARLKRWDREA
jgi:hypothetical protein